MKRVERGHAFKPSSFGLVILGFLLTGCMTVACDLDDQKLGNDCYECTRKATVEAQQVDPDKVVASVSRTGLRSV